MNPHDIWLSQGALALAAVLLGMHSCMTPPALVTSLKIAGDQSASKVSVATLFLQFTKMQDAHGWAGTCR